MDDGKLSLDENVVSAETAWEMYRQHPTFILERVVFSQFEKRLKDHRKQVEKKFSSLSGELEALAHDRLLFPRQTHNHRGEPVFDLSAAKPKLREDVAAKRHEGKTASEFRKTRPEYKGFKPDIFKGRISQEVRRQKCINHLEQDRLEKELQRKERAEKARVVKERERQLRKGNA